LHKQEILKVVSFKKTELEILGLSSSHSQSGSYALVLGELSGNRRLPIIIGAYEAHAIAAELERISINRPMTHDLFISFAASFDYSITEVLIEDLREGVFYAFIVAKSSIDGRICRIDARPSDAIAIAVRFGVQIFTNEKVLSEAGILINEETGTSKKESSKEEKEEKLVEKASFEDSLLTMEIDTLHKLLEEALAKEEYEKAAKIRDAIHARE